MFALHTQIKEKYSGEIIDKGPNYNADPTGIRTGNPPEGTLCDTLQRMAQDLDEYVDKVHTLFFEILYALHSSPHSLLLLLQRFD